MLDHGECLEENSLNSQSLDISQQLKMQGLGKRRGDELTGPYQKKLHYVGRFNPALVLQNLGIDTTKLPANDRDHLVSPFGHQIALTGRETAIANVISYVTRHKFAQTTDRNEHPTIAFAGRPGIGKSRMLDEIPDILANHFKTRVWDIKVKFQGEQQIHDCDKISPVAAFCWRMLYSFFRISIPF